MAVVTDAMKIPHLESAARAALGLAFLEEGELVTSLKYSHIVSIIDSGRPMRGLPFMVMERLRGQTNSGHNDCIMPERQPARDASLDASDAPIGRAPMVWVQGPF